MQLVYLLLRRHLRIIKRACHVIFDRNELVSAVDSLGLIIGAASERIKTLTGKQN
jgi:hypothetical protein